MKAKLLASLTLISCAASAAAQPPIGSDQAFAGAFGDSRSLLRAWLGEPASAGVPAAQAFLLQGDDEETAKFVRELIAVLESGDETGQRRENAASTLGLMGQAAASALPVLHRTAVWAENSIERGFAQKAAREIEESLPADEAPEARRERADAIMNAVLTRPPWLTKLSPVAEETGLFFLAKKLGEFAPQGDASLALPKLSELLDNSSINVRIEAIVALGKIGGRARSVLAKLVRMRLNEDSTSALEAEGAAIKKIMAEKELPGEPGIETVSPAEGK